MPEYRCRYSEVTTDGILEGDVISIMVTQVATYL